MIKISKLQHWHYTNDASSTTTITFDVSKLSNLSFTYRAYQYGRCRVYTDKEGILDTRSGSGSLTHNILNASTLTFYLEGSAYASWEPYYFENIVIS